MMRFSDVRFYDRNLNLIYVLPRYTSSDWQLSYKTYGTGELHFAKTAETVSLFTSHKFLFVSQGLLQGFVTGVRIGEDCAVFLRTPEWFFTKFTVADFTPTSTYASAVACELVAAAMPQVSVQFSGEDVDTTDKSDFAVSDATDLLSAIKSCLTGEKTGFSFGFSPEDKQFTFRVYQSRERQNAVFSEELKTMYDACFTKSLLSATSGGVFYHKITNGGKWDPVENVPILWVTPENYGKYYTVTADCEYNNIGIPVKKGDVILCKSIDGTFTVTDRAEPFPVWIAPEETGIFAWQTYLSAKTQAEAEQEIAEHKETATVEGKTKQLIYGTDFLLGDIVTAVFSAEDFCKREKRIIIGVHIWEDASSFGCLPETSSLTQHME